MQKHQIHQHLTNVLKPREMLTVSQWASKNRILTSDTSSEVGPWKNSRTPYLVEIMDGLSKHSEVEQIYCMLPTQIGKTEIGLNWIASVIDYDPSGMLFVDASEDAIKMKFKTRLDRMIYATPIVYKKIQDYKSRSEADARLIKEFLGGFILGVGLVTSKGARSHPVKYIFADEIDTYPIDVSGEGDPISLLKKRQETYIDKKFYASSTPKIKGMSLIESCYLKGDQRKYFVPCPECGEFQILEFPNLIFTDMDDIYYECKACKNKIQEQDKDVFLELGEWRPTAECDMTIRSYHMNALYAPFGWTSWKNIATQFKEAQTSKTLLKTFINTVLAETWEEQGEAPSVVDLNRLRQDYVRGELPDGVCVLTAGVDIQKDRIEVEVVGWGYGLQSWHIDYKIYKGDTNNSNSICWTSLSELLNKPFISKDGKEFFIEMTCVDSGFRTDYVYNFVAGHNFCTAIKGVDVLRNEKVFVLRGRGRTTHYSIDTFRLKTFLYESLTDTETLAKCNFPKDTDAEYFRQLTSEEKRDKVNKMGTISGKEFVKVYERNEALDCRVYSLVGAHMLGLPDWDEDAFTRYRENVEGLKS